MLVEINLLPKKERKNAALLFILFITLFFAAIGSAVFYFYMQRAEQKIESLTKQIEQIKTLRITEEQKLANTESLTAVQDLENAVNWAKDYPIKTVLLLKELSKLLPERGFMMNFSYEEAGSIQLTVQFDTSREAAYYLKALSDAEFVAEAYLASLTVEEKKDYISSTNENKTNEMKNVLPRYIGQYQIKVNKEVLKKLEKEERQ
ncbi:type IV pilus assembly protein PilN [Anoxybacillus vitaminiphilus]|jgi:type IV pilus assembly protein PilN|uniref:Type IV pilus assembly protein PilN n=1 Tax=Paranoxybacillus vitaminiphilus TaxID=581036 RepID=A0A327YKB1_9BACL|nr:fimbrial protein [Anoxybacillus vitaminiphilus]RAK21383.1 type IV pilus assembly protein PilN [Anoxybacillus vitaminiphilus]